jgi:murein DD-endopeptidase MepM/ murein hydrolase activator NlpD
VLLRIASDRADDLLSTCEDSRVVVKSADNTSVIQWQPKGRCTFPLVTFGGKNYILPLPGLIPEIETLSDVSIETLENTQRAGIAIRNDFKLSSLNVRQFFENVDKVLAARKVKLAFPIKSPLPTKSTHLPNSPRPYRVGETDGIHHGWDFYTAQGTPVIAIDDGIITHVKRDFNWKEMDNLLEGDTDLEKQENLDVYRGNTVYIKTIGGHVGIYAHLDSIPASIEVGKRVKKGTILGHVGGSAVPDKKYLYHLHFELAMNPFDDKKAGNYTHDDVLLWPWFGKGKNTDWVRDNDESVFE